MFNNKVGLTNAVLKGYKGVTRDIIEDWKVLEYNVDFILDEQSKEEIIERFARYKVGEIVAIAQPYKDIISQLADRQKEYVIGFYSNSAGWTNKMFVRADLMPNKIEITDVKVERLQEITGDEILKEGVWYDEKIDRFMVKDKGFFLAKSAFQYIIDKVSGKGTWERNPYVFAYSFKLVK